MRTLNVCLLTLMAVGLSLGACKTTSKSILQTDGEEARQSLPAEAQQLWDIYVQELTSKNNLQQNCIPIQLKPRADQAPKGLVVLYHGFTGCSIQFINVGRQLADLGYHVLLPLLPGEGRKPLLVDPTKQLIKDDTSEMPTSIEPYYQLSRRMNEIARRTPGLRVVGGLSGGGSQAMGSLVEGVDAASGKNLWDRSLIFVPLIKLPGFQGNLAAFINLFLPALPVGFGKDCDKAFLATAIPRNGTCDFTVAQVQALEAFGRSAAERASSITIPIQIVAVEKDGATDDTEISKFFDRLGSTQKQLCFYPEGVEHAILFESDYLLADTRTWVPEVESKLIRFVQDGSSFETNGVSVAEKNRPLCQLTAPLPNRK